MLGMGFLFSFFLGRVISMENFQRVAFRLISFDVGVENINGAMVEEGTELIVILSHLSKKVSMFFAHNKLERK